MWIDAHGEFRFSFLLTRATIEFYILLSFLFVAPKIAHLITHRIIIIRSIFKNHVFSLWVLNASKTQRSFNGREAFIVLTQKQLDSRPLFWIPKHNKNTVCTPIKWIKKRRNKQTKRHFASGIITIIIIESITCGAPGCVRWLKWCRLPVLLPPQLLLLLLLLLLPFGCFRCSNV